MSIKLRTQLFSICGTRTVGDACVIFRGYASSIKGKIIIKMKVKIFVLRNCFSFLGFKVDTSECCCRSFNLLTFHWGGDRRLPNWGDGLVRTPQKEMPFFNKFIFKTAQKLQIWIVLSDWFIQYSDSPIQVTWSTYFLTLTSQKTVFHQHLTQISSKSPM